MPDVQPPYVHCQPQTLGVRIGDRVIVTEGDKFVETGMTGLVVNVVTAARFSKPVRARVLFDNDTICIIDSAHFQVLPRSTSASAT